MIRTDGLPFNQIGLNEDLGIDDGTKESEDLSRFYEPTDEEVQRELERRDNENPA